MADPMTLTTLPPVLESAVKKMAKEDFRLDGDYGGGPALGKSWSKISSDHREHYIDAARKRALAFLNALLADGKAREWFESLPYSSNPPPLEEPWREPLP